MIQFLIFLFLSGAMAPQDTTAKASPQDPGKRVGATAAVPADSKTDDATTDGVTGLRIRQETRGIPGRAGGEDQRVTQVISVTSKRLRLDDPSGGSYLLLRVDEGADAFYEVALDQSQYRKGKDLDKVQHDRDRVEKYMLAEILEKPADERAQRLRDEHLRADGSREVKVDVKPAKNKILGHNCKRYVVRENGRVIVDVDVTDELAVTIPFFDYYRRVGAFSDEVLAELKKIKGVPLRADITVVTAGLNYDLSVVATSVAKTSFRPDLFELPQGAKEIVESTMAPCGECGKSVEKSAPGGRATVDSEPIYFCCKECKKSWRKRRYGDLGRPGAPKPGAQKEERKEESRKPK